MRNFVSSQLLEKISIIAFCVVAAASLSFCSLAVSRICALAKDVAVDARDVWGLHCDSSVFFPIWELSIPHPGVDLFDNFNCCWWIWSKKSHFLLFRSRCVRSWSNRALWPSTLLWHLHGRHVTELLLITFFLDVFLKLPKSRARQRFACWSSWQPLHSNQTRSVPWNISVEDIRIKQNYLLECAVVNMWIHIKRIQLTATIFLFRRIALEVF